NRAAAEKGLPVPGRAPYGYTMNMTALVPDEVVAIREAAELVLIGESLTDICRLFNERGWSMRGRAFTRPALRKVLVSARIVGDREYHGKVVATGTWL